MSHVWVLVCDAAKARIFEVRAGSPSWQVVDLLLHEGSRSKTSDLVSSASGTRSSEGRSAHHNALAPATSPREVEKDAFARTLAATLEQGMRSARFEKWVLVAPPHFLGLMRKELTTQLERHLLTTVDKDLSELTVGELSDRLHDAVNDAKRTHEEEKHSHK